MELYSRVRERLADLLDEMLLKGPDHFDKDHVNNEEVCRIIIIIIIK